MNRIAQYILKNLSLATALVTLLVPVAVCGDVIELRGNAAVAGETVRLRDVAKLVGGYAESLGDVKLAELAKVGAGTRVDRQAVERALTSNGANWAKLILKGTTKVAITRTPEVKPSPEVKAAPEVKPLVSELVAEVSRVEMKTLGDQIVGWVNDRVGAVAGELRVEFGLGQESVLGLGLGDYEFLIDPMDVSRLGVDAVNVRCWRDGKFIAERGVSLSIKKRVELAIAKRAIRSGGVIVGDDLEMRVEWVDLGDKQPRADATWLVGRAVERSVRMGSEWRMVLKARRALKSGSVVGGGDMTLAASWVEPFERGLMWDASEVVGQQLNGSVREGGLMDSGNLIAPLMVRRGQPVTLRCVSGSFVVKVSAVATEDGRGGELVEFQRLNSREKVFAMVTGPQEAVIDLVGTTQGVGR